MNISLLRPVSGGRVSQWFGGHPEWYARFGLPGHNGLDYAVPVGTSVYAAHDGVLEVPPPDPGGYGMYVIVRGRGFYTLYAHLTQEFRMGGPVKAGELIAYSGNTGNSTGPHLHFGLRVLKPYFLSQPFRGWVDPWAFRD